MLEKNQKTEARKMLEYIAAAMQQPMPQTTINMEERMNLKQYWNNGTKSQEQYNTILAVYNRFKGIKTPEQTTQALAEWVREGRKKNGLA